MRRLVLAGAGHAHALVLLELARAPIGRTEVVVVSPEPQAPYSGMVPGWLAGRYRFDQIVIDCAALAAAAGACWVQGELDAVDAARRRLRLADGSELGYDVLSLNVGSTLRPPPAAAHATVLPLRPLTRLHGRIDALLAAWAADASERPLAVDCVGAGAAGFESLLALLARLRALRPDRTVRGCLLARGAGLLPALSAPARRAAHRALRAAGVELRVAASAGELLGRGSDIVMWATGAQAHGWQLDADRRGALAVDEAGFVRVDACLRSVSHPWVFATGDCARWHGAALPKAGVHAVRMGPVLAHNLRAALGEPVRLRPYRPPRQVLALLATGDGRAIASRGLFGAEGAWVWRWKDRIDRRFVGRFGRPGAAAVVAAAAVAAASGSRSTPA